MLAGTNVALGVTGSVAAVRVVELAHELRRQGASVRAVMTDSARSIVHPYAVEFATDNPVVTEITGAVEHVNLCGRDGWADVLLVAPATANTVGKLAAAIDDTPVTTTATTAFGADVPVVVFASTQGISGRFEDYLYPVYRYARKLLKERQGPTTDVEPTPSVASQDQ